MRINVLETETERREAFPILEQLRSHLDYEQFESLYEQMATEGYRFFCGYDDGTPIGVVGVTLSTNFYLGRHAYVYDLVVDEDHRSEGYGQELLEYVHEWAQEHDCEAVELESGHWRDDAHRFYTDRMGYEQYCHSFKYELE